MALKKTLISLSIIALLFLACGGSATEMDLAASPPSKGEKVYNTQCTLCHGKDGGMGISGAKDLRASTLVREEIVALVSNGKGAMAAYKNVLTKAEIGAVADHVLSLRHKE